MSYLNKITLVVFSFSLSPAVYALCKPQLGFKTQDVSMTVGRVVVRPSDPVGKILNKSTFPISSNGSTYYCNTTSSIEAVLTQNYPLSALGNSIYDTNLPGIGIRLYREASEDTTFSNYYPYKKTLYRRQNYHLSSGYFVIEIIKTAPTTSSGALAPGRYSSYHSTGYANSPFLTSTLYGNAITIASSSCELQQSINKVINLPTVNAADFNGIGSTQGEQAFELSILCNGGSNSTSYQVSNKISLSFDFNADSTSSNVLANNATAGSSASGVGVQLLTQYHNSHQVIAKNEKLELGTLQSNGSMQYLIPMTARYYQTEAKVKAGKVQTMATITIQYD